MRKIPISMIFCALLGTTISFAQNQEPTTLKGTIDSEESLYKNQNPYSPNEWEMIKEENIAWKKRVWRTIDLADKGNDMLGQSSTHASVGEVLLNGLYSDAFKPRSVYTDDRFTTELTAKDIEALRSLRGQKITSLKIKEDWIMRKDNNKMVVRIVAMAPVTGSGDEAQPAFWIYYPEARTYLAQQRIASPGNSPETLDEVFEGRFFSSAIDKVSEPIKTQ